MNILATMSATALLWFVSAEFAKAGSRLTPEQVLPIIRGAHLDGFGTSFTEAEILAFIKIESDFVPNAFRYEKKLNEASMGLMQLLPSTARDRGYLGTPSGLFDPAANIRIAMSHLDWIEAYFDRRNPGPVDKGTIVAAYNAGVGNVAGGFRNHAYIARWDAARKSFG